MKTLKLSKSKGFTLIELMVVISIITLLSSVVLASVKTAREKAQITKTVAEMKSLQTAIELYRNQFGVYPKIQSVEEYNAHTWYDDNETTGYGNFDNLIQTTLVNNKFISKVPHAQNYPNNCNSNCYTNGYVLGYFREDINDAYIMSCGEKNVTGYAITFMANDKKVNLPIASYSNDVGDTFVNYLGDFPNTPPYTYCLSM